MNRAIVLIALLILGLSSYAQPAYLPYSEEQQCIPNDDLDQDGIPNDEDTDDDGDGEEDEDDLDDDGDGVEDDNDSDDDGDCVPDDEEGDQGQSSYTHR